MDSQPIITKTKEHTHTHRKLKQSKDCPCNPSRDSKGAKYAGELAAWAQEIWGC